MSKLLINSVIHARPAALFVKTAAQFECDIFVERNGSAVSGKSIMGVLTLEGHCGAILKLMADGPDAQQAVDALEELIKNKFYED